MNRYSLASYNFGGFYFMNFFYRSKLFFLFLVLSLTSFGACGGKNSEKFQCAGLKKIFPNLTVPLPKGQRYTLFKTKNKTEYGCMGVVWEGQTNDPPSYIMKITADGNYQLQNPTTKKFMSDGINGTVAAGISKVRIVAFIMKGANPTSLNCTSIIKGDLAGCWDNSNCLMAWNITDVPSTSDGSGSCQICQREVCNGKDDNCNGKIDEGVCGKVMGIQCKYATKLSPSCNGNCSCIVVGSQKTTYVCTGAAKTTLSWQTIDSVMGLCASDKDDGKNYFCGSNVKLLCDTCASKKVFRHTEASTRCGSDSEFRFISE